MSTPFPGVDPFLESQGLWLEFHSKFVNCWQEILLDQLPSGYDARLDERVYLTDIPEGEARLICPDVAVRLPLEDEAHEPFIRILHREDQELIGVLEVLSPTNKVAPSLAEYRQKRSAILRQSIHLVELDLLVGGRRLPTLDPLPASDFYALVSRAECRPDCQAYSWTVRDPVPSIPIPLKAPDPDLLIDLNAVFQMAFQRGRYERAIRYERSEGLAFDPSVHAWIVERAAQSPR